MILEEFRDWLTAEYQRAYDEFHRERQAFGADATAGRDLRWRALKEVLDKLAGVEQSPGKAV